MTALITECRDAVLLSRLHHDCFEDGWSEDSCAALLRNTVNKAWLLANDTNPVAFLWIATIAGEQEILSIGTLPLHRGKGHAATLLGDVLAREQAEQVFLEVRVDNHAAIALYEKLGFTHSGHRKNYYKPQGNRTRDALVYSKNIR